MFTSGRQEVPAVRIFEAQFTRNAKCHGGSTNTGMTARSAVDAHIIAFQKSGDLTKVTTIEKDVGFELIGARSWRSEIPVRGAVQVAEAVSGTVGARRRTGKL